MKRLVLHIYIMFMALTAMACPSNEVKLVQDWDKTFPKSEKVNHKKVKFKTQYGFTLAADLKNKTFTMAGGVVDPLPEDAPQFVKDYHAYYKTPRGYHKRSGNSNDGGAPRAARLTPTPVSSITSTKSVRQYSLCMERKHIPATSEKVPSDI